MPYNKEIIMGPWTIDDRCNQIAWAAFSNAKDIAYCENYGLHISAESRRDEIVHAANRIITLREAEAKMRNPS